MATVELRNVDKVFPGGVRAVKDISLDVAEGELLVLVGPSGCGKSTILRMLAGSEEVTAGQILIDGQTVNQLPPQQRNVAMVFQNYALYPHKTVRQNLAFPLRMMNVPKDQRSRRVEEVADTLGLSRWLDQRPKNLSGGQRQRVAMGRAMVRKPSVFLLDEPLSNLDAKLRVQIRAEIAQLQRRMGATMIYVTHDQVEAMTLGGRVAVLSEGELQQVGTGQELYDRPANTFVAGFIGSPAMNLFRTQLHREEGGGVGLEFGERRLSVSEQTLRRHGRIDALADRPLIAGLRPEAFTPESEADPGNRVELEVATSEALGHENIVYFDSPAPLVAAEGGRAGETADSPGRMSARLPATEAPPEVGSRITLGIDTTRLLLFDPQGHRLGDAGTL